MLFKRHQHHAPLARLISESDQRESLTQAVRALLPASLAESVEVVNYRTPSLVLRVGNASVATRLRYALPELTQKLTNLAEFQGLTRINLRVVQTVDPLASAKKPRYLSKSAVETLTQVAGSLQDQPDYHQLREAILRLSEHTPPTVTDPAED